MKKKFLFQFILSRNTTRWQFGGAALMVLSILLAKAGDLDSESQTTIPPAAIFIAAFASVNSGAVLHTVQGDASGRTKPIIDMKTKVAF